MSFVQGLEGLGLLGLFLASFLGHFSIVMKDVIFVPLLLYMSQFWDPLTLGLVGGFGGGLGELSTYLIGKGVGKFTLNDVNRTEIPGWVRKLGLFSVLLSSLTPLPDAPVLLLLGSTHFPVSAVLALEIIGKTVLYAGGSMVGGVLYSHLTVILPAPWDSVLIIIISLGFSCIVTWKRTRIPIFRFVQNTINKLKGFWKRREDT